jgi:hypothetical protein
MSRLIHLAAQASRARPAAELAVAVRRPEKAQARYLARLLARNRDTEFGRAHGFAELTRPEAYARRVPLMTAADLEPWVRRLMRGERRLLTEEHPVFYGRSTGSGGNHKHIPITPSYQAEFQRTVHAAFWHLFLRIPRGFTSRLLYFVGPRRVAVADDGNDIGSMSGYNFTALPPLVRRMYAWPVELFAIDDLEARSYVALQQAVVGDISLVTGVFPLPIVAMLRDLEARAEELARDLRRGTLDGAPALDADQRRFFARARPDLAARLERAARAPVEDKARLAFPRLGLVYCWTTATAGLYVPELRRRLGPDIAVRDAIYAATEAWCNVCVGDEEPGGPAAVTSVYLELIPEAGGEPLPLAAARDGARYQIVVTCSAGLYRYVLGDIVEVCGFHQRTPRIRFVRKVGAASNLAGELLDESHVNQAVGRALAALGLEATWFALVADPAGPGYRLHVEGAAHEQLADLVDRELGAAAYSYGDLRGEGQLRPIRLVRIPDGRYAAWRRTRLAEGAGEAQLKTAHLFDDPTKLPVELRAEP